MTPEDEEWPTWPFTALALAAAHGLRCGLEPLALWVRGTGDLAAMSERAVAVVGSRAASGYGQHIATEFGYGLAEAGVVVLSGAAYGIDGAAHRGALAAGGRPSRCSPAGWTWPTPPGTPGCSRGSGNGGWWSASTRRRTRPPGTDLLTRKRLIAALGDGTVVVEAGRRSGAKNTAASTSALGRVLMAVPGPITSASSVGCHELLRTGEAIAVSSAAEVIESTGRIGADLVESTRRSSGLGPAQGDAMRVHEALGLTSGSSAESIAVESGVALPKVRALLPELELAGLAARVESGWQRRDLPQ